MKFNYFTRNKQNTPVGQEGMEPLSVVDAVKLLNKYAANQVDHKKVAIKICEKIGRLPLAVQLVGQYLSETNESASSYLHWLKENLLDVSKLNLNKTEYQHQLLWIVLARNIAQLNDTGRQMLSAFSCLAMKSVELNMLEESLTFSQIKTEKATESLINLGLIQRKNDQYEVSHTLIHTYIREQVPAQQEVTLSLAIWYLNFVVEETQKGPQSYHLLDNEQAHIFSLIKYAHQQKQWREVINLVLGIKDYLHIRGYLKEQKYILSLALTAAQAVEQRDIEGVIVSALGNVYSNLEELDKAIDYYQQSLCITKELGNRATEGLDLNNLGNAYYWLNEMDKAIDYYQQALTLSREVGDKQTEGNTLGNLGNAYFILNELNKTTGFYQQALAISKEIGDHHAEGQDLGNLGLVYKALGKLDKAIDYYQQALVISRKLGAQLLEGNTLNSLGAAYEKQYKVEIAHDYYQQALAVYEAIHSPEAELARDNLKIMEQALAALNG